MKESYGNVLFVVGVISTIVVLSAGSLFYVQTNSPARFLLPPAPTVFVKQFAIRTQVIEFVNGGIDYEWSISLTNEGRTPITAIEATLVLSNGNIKYTQNSFLIVSIIGPPATSFVRNPPWPFVSSTVPLFFNNTAFGNTITISPRYLVVGESIPLTITVTYANGTLSDAETSARVVFVGG